MKRMIWLFVLILCFSSVDIRAQETARADEIFAWFPQGAYMMIKHYDSELFAKGKAYPLYMEFFGPPSEQADKADESAPRGMKKRKKGDGLIHATMVGEGDVLLNHLPPSLREGLYSSTTAHPIALADVPEDTPEVEEMIISSPEGEPEVTIKGIFVMQHTTMEVHRYHDLDGAIKNALAKGEISDTGRKIARRPIYTLSQKPGDERSSSFYAWASETQELLIASSIDHLRKMVLTGRGMMMNLLDDPDLADLPAIVPDLGARWSIASFKNSHRQLDEIMADQGISIERKERIEDRQENEPLYTVDSWKVDDEIVNRKMTVYDDSSRAKEALKRNPGGARFSGTSQEFVNYNNTMAQQRKTERLGNIVVNTIIYDRELLELQKSAMESLAAGGGTVILRSYDGTITEVHAQEVENEKVKKKDK